MRSFHKAKELYTLSFIKIRKMKGKKAGINFWTIMFVLALLFLAGALIFLLAAKGKLDSVMDFMGGLFGP